MSDSEESKDKSQPTATMSAVSIKLPPYWPNDPAIWFAQVEAQFSTRGITNQNTMYAYVVSSLQPAVAEELRDLLLNPPTTQPYDKIKAELITRMSSSDQKRLHQLLISEELGDRKPSQLLRRMQQLLGERTLEDSILKTLFLQRLPTNVQSILATSDSLNTEQLANIADRIMEVGNTATPAQQTVASIKPGNPNKQNEIEELRSMVATLTTQVTELSDQIRRDRGRSQNRNFNRKGKGSWRSNSRSKSKDGNRVNDTGECYYHRKFKEKAYKCRPGCTYPAKQQSNDKASE